MQPMPGAPGGAGGHPSHHHHAHQHPGMGGPPMFTTNPGTMNALAMGQPGHPGQPGGGYFIPTISQMQPRPFYPTGGQPGGPGPRGPRWQNTPGQMRGPAPQQSYQTGPRGPRPTGPMTPRGGMAPNQGPGRPITSPGMGGPRGVRPNMRGPQPGGVPPRFSNAVRPSGMMQPGGMNQTPVPQQSVTVAGQEPLTASMLAAADAGEQKQMLGERLYPLIANMHQNDAGKITGMLLEIDNSELLHMLEHNESLKAKVDEAVAVLQAHHAKEIASGGVKKE